MARKEPRPKPVWQCPYCDREFVTGGALDRHIASDHPGQAPRN